MQKWFLTLTAVLLALLFIFAACDDGSGDDDDDSGPDDDDSGDDDDDDDLPMPTTLDKTIQVVELDGGGYTLEIGPGEAHEVRNDLSVEPLDDLPSGDPLSISYLLIINDFQLTDEESPARLTFFDSNTIFGGMFEAAWRPQEDLSPHIVDGAVRTANRIQVDYERDFDLALALGDLTDNAQYNEMLWVLDVLDGSGLSSGTDGVCRPDSGDLDIDSDTGRNKGERDFGFQQETEDGEVINPFEKEGRPVSNADFDVVGLRTADGERLPWFAVIGNHDALNTGNFDPDSTLTFFSRDEYLGTRAKLGHLPGVVNMIDYVRENPGEPVYLADGLFGMNVNYAAILPLLEGAGMIPNDIYADLYPDFDLQALQANTPADGSDDGVTIAADANRVFAGEAGFVDLMHEAGHGFDDTNQDGAVDAADGGYYEFDLAGVRPDSVMPLRFVMLNTAEDGQFANGGITDGQLAWLEARLRAAEGDGMLVVVCSHHPVDAVGDDEEALQSLLHSSPNVILHLVGHEHKNDVTPMIDPGGDPLYSYWQVETASIIDWPGQARIVEIVDNRDGTGSIVTTNFDHRIDAFGDVSVPSEYARWLAFQDALRKAEDPLAGMPGAGQTDDRNLELVFAIPEAIALDLAEIPATGPVTSREALGTLY